MLLWRKHRRACLSLSKSLSPSFTHTHNTVVDEGVCMCFRRTCSGGCMRVHVCVHVCVCQGDSGCRPLCQQSPQPISISPPVQRLHGGQAHVHVKFNFFRHTGGDSSPMRASILPRKLLGKLKRLGEKSSTQQEGQRTGGGPDCLRNQTVLCECCGCNFTTDILVHCGTKLVFNHLGLHTNTHVQTQVHTNADNHRQTNKHTHTVYSMWLSANQLE